MFLDLYNSFILFDFSQEWFLATFILCFFVALTIVTLITCLRVSVKLFLCLIDIIRLWGE